MAGMDETSTTFLSDADGMTIQATCWSPGVEPRAVVQIAHGMGEHSARYARFAEALTDAGYIVYTSDHRGHGRTAGSSERHGDLGDGGWDALVADVGQLGRIARADNPGKSFALFGHSMGSFAAQQFVLDHSDELDALVLSGSTAVDVIAAQLDPNAETDLSAFNEPFGDRTDFEWLSRDEAEVDRYVADEACGFGLNPAGTGGMIEGAMLTGQPERIDAIRKDLPILIASGDADPLAAGGDLIRLLESRYRDAGLIDVTVELYPEARHEILNETNRDEVTGDILAFLDRTIGR